MRFVRITCTSILILLLQVFPVSASAKEFSAEAYQQYPQGQSRTAKMHIGKNGVRREYTHNRQTIIEIYRPSKGQQIIIFPAQRSYQLREGVKVRTGLEKPAGKPVNPCEGNKTDTCKSLGQEKIAGRVVEKWEVSRQSKGKTIRALMWIDVERGQALRQFFPDGSAVELLNMGSETIDGRQTEKWVMQQTRPDGTSEKTFQWYDPELGITIKEVLTGGFTRELRNIKQGQQPASLFEIPEGYRQIELTAPGQK